MDGNVWSKFKLKKKTKKKFEYKQNSTKKGSIINSRYSIIKAHMEAIWQVRPSRPMLQCLSVNC